MISSESWCANRSERIQTALSLSVQPKPNYSRWFPREASEQLKRVLTEKKLRDAVLLIPADRQDLPDSMTAAEIESGLDLRSLRNKNW